MAHEKLDGLEYPRLMHGEHGDKRRVENVEEAEQALKDGFTIHPELTDEQKKAVAAAEKSAPKTAAPGHVPAAQKNDFGVGEKKK